MKKEEKERREELLPEPTEARGRWLLFGSWLPSL
jgi:hypothetical protein